MSDPKDQDSDKAQSNVNDPAAIEKARKEAAAANKAKVEAQAKIDSDKAKGKGVKVISNVNMIAKDGTRLRAGKEALLTQAEHDRLSDEPRFAKKPAFKLAK